MFSDMTKKELVKAVEKADLPVSGTKAELIERLGADMTKDELVKEAKKADLPVSGTKAELIDRLSADPEPSKPSKPSKADKAKPAPKRPKSTSRQEIHEAREDMILAQRRLMRLNSFDASHEEYGDIADAEAALTEAEANFMALSSGWYPARNGKR